MKQTLLTLSVGTLLGVSAVAQTNPTPIASAPVRSRAVLTRLSGGLTNKAWVSASGLRATNVVGANLARARDAAPAKRLVLEDVGPHHQTWKAAPDDAASSATNRFGAARSNAGARVVSIGSGMNYWDGAKWAPSDPSFEVSPEGDAFVANKLHYKVRLQADDLNTVGSLTVTTPEGHVLRSTPVAIGLYDAQSGQSRILAGMKKCPGVLVSSNSVVYDDAFNENGVRASVVFTAERGSFAADVVLTAPLDPADYGFPAKTTRIQVYTEYYNPPAPDRIRNAVRVEKDEKVRQRMASPDLIDETLGFGECVFSGGRVYATGTNATTAAPVAKEFKTLGARTFMIESVEFPDIQDGLQAMAGGKTNRVAFKSIGGNKRGYAAIPKPSDGRTGILPVGKRPRTELAKITPRELSGVVIDPVLTLGGTIYTNKVFQGDTTYFVAQPYYCNGPVTIEGGAVFKYPNSTGPNPTTAFIQLNNTVTCKTWSYRPAIFTAGDDDSIGELIGEDVWPGVTGELVYLDENQELVEKHYANPALAGFSSLTLSHCRFAYANVALRGGTVTVNHSQFLRCVQGISVMSWGSGSGASWQASLNNCLLADVSKCVGFDFSSTALGASLYLKHCTLAGVNEFVHGGGGIVSANAMNSIFANVTNLAVGGNVTLSGSYNGFYPDAIPYTSLKFGTSDSRRATDADPFQESGGGHYYLTANASHPFRGGVGTGGTTGVGTTLLNQLTNRTTQPPIAFPRHIFLTGELTLFPQVGRYVSGSPDLGYHYGALDYTVAAMHVENGGRVTVEPGTAIGFRQEVVPPAPGGDATLTYLGFALWEGSTFTCRGAPANPVTFADVQFVQEQVTWRTWAFFVPWFIQDEANTPPPALDFQFSNFSPSQGCLHFFSGYDEQWRSLSRNSPVNLNLRDCNLSGGMINLGKTHDYMFPDVFCTVTAMNSLFDRVEVIVDPHWLDDQEANPSFQVDTYLRFQANNNLFRGGRLRLVPVPTSPSWQLTDNLFEGIAFEQVARWDGQMLPLDHDYNGYFPQTNPNLGANQRTHLLVDYATPNTYAANDRPLTSTPAYQTGPLGDYYLQAYSPLYQTAKRGSRTAADAGLFHYTTRWDQQKDGRSQEAGNNVIIGRHYVATTSSTSAQPKDSDTPTPDGIPDYVENWHGDGDTGASRIHTVDETDWNLAMTDGSTTDSLNTICDDVDLDGDGMVGIVEKLWSKNPLFSDNPLSLDGLPTSVQGIQEVPIGLPLNAVQDETGLQMVVVGPTQPGPVESSGAELVVEGAGAPKFIWNTAYDSYGESFVFLQKRPLTEHRPVHGAIRRVSVNNAFQVVDPFRRFGDTLVLEAQTMYANGFYRVSFFDAAGNPLTYSDGGQTREFSLTGQADGNGYMDVTWNLVFPDSATFAGDSVTMTVQVAPEAAGQPPGSCGPAATCPPFKWKHEPTWAQYDKFVTFIASERNQDRDDRLRYAMYTAIQGPLVNPEFQGTPYQLNPESQWYQNWGWPPVHDVRLWTWIFNGDTKANVVLRMAELDYRNLFYIGHGNTDRILTGPLAPPDRIYQEEIAAALGNNRESTAPGHPYRFVFLYACCTGRGTMPLAFGIPAEETSVNQFARRGLRARAFIGNTDPDQGASSSLAEAGGAGQAEEAALNAFFTEWRRGQADLQAILDSVKQPPPGSWGPGGIDREFVIRGAADLKRNSQP